MSAHRHSSGRAAMGPTGESAAAAACFEGDMVRPASSRIARVLLAAALLVPLVGAAPAGAVESLDYRWNLKGVLGRLAGVVVPNHGLGQLRSRPAEGGRITEL